MKKELRFDKLPRVSLAVFFAFLIGTSILLKLEAELNFTSYLALMVVFNAFFFPLYGLFVA
jgi:hypothetical protein